MKKLNIKTLNKRREALLAELEAVEADITKAGGNTYVIEYQACWTDKKPKKVTVKNAIDADDAVRKWREDYHRFDCQGCSGDYPIFDVYLKGNKTPKGEETYADRVRKQKDEELDRRLGAITKRYGLKI